MFRKKDRDRTAGDRGGGLSPPRCRSWRQDRRATRAAAPQGRPADRAGRLERVRAGRRADRSGGARQHAPAGGAGPLRRQTPDRGRRHPAVGRDQLLRPAGGRGRGRGDPQRHAGPRDRELGRFTGGCEVEEADISGVYEGDLTVRKRLFVRGSGKLTGTVRYGELELERAARSPATSACSATAAAASARRGRATTAMVMAARRCSASRPTRAPIPKTDRTSGRPGAGSPGTGNGRSVRRSRRRPPDRVRATIVVSGRRRRGRPDDAKGSCPGVGRSMPGSGGGTSSRPFWTS